METLRKDKRCWAQVGYDYCTKNAVFGSTYCQVHYDEFREKTILKNKIVDVFANTWGSVFLNIYHKDEKGSLVFEKQFKFEGHMENVDLEISIPPRCRTEYAKIIKVN